MADTLKLPGDIAAALADPKAYGQWSGLQDKFAWARQNMPLGVAEVPGFDPFWAVTRHAALRLRHPANDSGAEPC